ncbi:hypothetical protein DFO83_11183 [Idiomarina loihiensis]|uniref:hypothetical protein n=1 Tax=Idiomarina TaxID=135575 RepID=UPI000D71491A|nr:hypothetical protein [Idiomarina]PWW34556.1 hypothetical protein DFO83_11183 [Idiomarina loihiensis]TDP47686.1 hypothetical protein DET58_105298 [Idiomarina loihiensis]TDS23427.1 hypothetical protein DET62_105298 [Idiomarina sp. H2]
MSICLNLTSADISLTKDLVAIIGTFGALAIGILGLNTWRRQLHGTSKFEVAKNILTTTYKIEDAIQAVRSPMLHLRKEEVEAGRALEEEQRIYSERLQRLNEKRAELRTLALEARAIWGEQDHFDALQKLIGKLHSEIWLHFWLKGAYAGPGAQVDRSPERVAANDKIVYFINDEDDFTQQIKNAVSDIESVYKKRLRE